MDTTIGSITVPTTTTVKRMRSTGNLDLYCKTNRRDILSNSPAVAASDSAGAPALPLIGNVSSNRKGIRLNIDELPSFTGIDAKSIRIEAKKGQQEYFRTINSLKSGSQTERLCVLLDSNTANTATDDSDDIYKLKRNIFNDSYGSKGSGNVNVPLLSSSQSVQSLVSDSSQIPTYKEPLLELITLKDEYRCRYNMMRDNAYREGSYIADVRKNDFIRRDSIKITEIYAPETLMHPSPRAALLRESIKLNVIPFAIKEILEANIRTKSNRNNDSNNDNLFNTKDLIKLQRKKKVLVVDGDDSDAVDDDDEDVTVEGNEVISINLSYRGLGDVKGRCLAAALLECSAIQSINVQGNRLTDDSMVLILQSILDHTQCSSINLSDNKLDSLSISMLKENCESESCYIEELILSKSDIDDEECASLMTSINANQSIVKLILSHNLIGQMEEYNMVVPMFTTGGEAIADTININHSLLFLDLSHNNIRGDSAMTLATAVGINSSLKTLMLSHNNIGDKASQMLARGLRKNRCLTKLDISYNNIYPKGIFTLACMFQDNKHLKELNVNGNCIGNQAGKALLAAMRESSKHKRLLNIYFRESNTTYEDMTLFNMDCPTGVYQLKLDDPYDYCVARCILLIANTKPVTLINEIKYTGVNANGVSVINEVIRVKRTEKVVRENGGWDAYITRLNKIVDEIRRKQKAATTTTAAAAATASVTATDDDKLKADGRNAVISLCKAMKLLVVPSVASKILNHLVTLVLRERDRLHLMFAEIFRSIFLIVDRDGSGSVDCSELSSCLQLLGVKGITKDDSRNVSEEYLRYASRIIKAVDINNNNTLDLDEFIRMLFVNYLDTFPKAPTPLIDEGTGKLWVIPDSVCGTLKIDFYCNQLPPSAEELHSDKSMSEYTQRIRSVTNSEGERIEAFKLSIASTDLYLTCDQAEVLLHNFRDMQEVLTTTIVKVLPQISNTIEACKLIAQNLKFDEIVQLRKRMGCAFSVLTGNICGHYTLDMTKPYDRLAGRKLALINSLEREKNLIEHVHRDTSQAHSYENYRNDRINGKYVGLNSLYFQSTDVQHGRISFDYVSTSRPIPGIEAIADDAYRYIVDEILRVTVSKPMVKPVIATPTTASPVASPVPSTRRGSLLHQMAKKDTQKSAKRTDKETATAAPAGNSSHDTWWLDYITSSWEGYKYAQCCRLLKSLADAVGADRVADATDEELIDMYKEAMALPHFKHIVTKHTMYHVDIASSVKGMADNRFVKRLQGGNAVTRTVDSVVDCSRFNQFLLHLEVYLIYNIWLSCQQVHAFIVKLQAYDCNDYVLSVVICKLFDRIVDLKHIDVILKAVSNTVRLELYHRLGCLNSWSPYMAVEGVMYEFDLTCYDHRELFLILIDIAKHKVNSCNTATATATATGDAVTIDDVLCVQYRTSLIDCAPIKSNWKIPVKWVDDSIVPDYGHVVVYFKAVAVTNSSSHGSDTTSDRVSSSSSSSSSKQVKHIQLQQQQQQQKHQQKLQVEEANYLDSIMSDRTLAGSYGTFIEPMTD